MLADSWIRLRHHATLVFCRSSPKYTLQHYAICCLGSVGQTVIVGSSSSGPFGGKPGLESNVGRKTRTVVKEREQRERFGGTPFVYKHYRPGKPRRQFHSSCCTRPS